MKTTTPETIYVAQTYRRSRLVPVRLIWNDVEAATPEELQEKLKTISPEFIVRRKYIRRRKKGGTQ